MTPLSLCPSSDGTELCDGYLESVEYRENLRVVKEAHFVFNSRVWIDAANVKAYYHGIRRGDGQYRFPYQFAQIQDLVVYADDLEKGQFPVFPANAFESLCDLILSDSVSLDLLQFLVDLVRNLSALPSLHPVVADMVFMEKMLRRIVEMEEHLGVDGSGNDMGREVPLYVLEATAVSAVANCYKFPTVITRNVLDIAIELLHHDQSPTIRLMAAKLLYNLALELRMEMLSTLFPLETLREFGEDEDGGGDLIARQDTASVRAKPYESYHFNAPHSDFVPLRDEDEDDEEIYGQEVGPEIELEVKSLSMNKSSKFSLFQAAGQLVEMGSFKKNKSQSVHRQINDYSTDSMYSGLSPLAQSPNEPEPVGLRMERTDSDYVDNEELKMESEPKAPDLSDPLSLRAAAQQIERDLAETICDEVVSRLNGQSMESKEGDVRVRSLCLQTLGLLLVSNPQLLQYVDGQIGSLKAERPRRDYIEYGFWKKMDRECAVNGDLHHDVVYLIRAPLRSADAVGHGHGHDDKEEEQKVATGDMVRGYSKVTVLPFLEWTCFEIFCSLKCVNNGTRSLCVVYSERIDSPSFPLRAFSLILIARHRMWWRMTLLFRGR